MMKKRKSKEERRRWAEDHPRVRLLRELEEMGLKELEARGLETERTKLARRYFPAKPSES
jgi:hypothetical protein